ncbi:MAG: ParB/RepB/Spo0J family partition protein [Pyrinomonadaceae bacterium]
MARQPLGRGLSALLGEDTSSDEALTVEVDIDLIEPNPEQPRTRFVESDLDDLTKSIRANGIIQPIVVRKAGGRYQIVAGERRWRAAQAAELRRVPVTVREVSDEKLLELALIENIQRQELNPIEEARAYRKLIDKIGLTQEVISDRIGKSRNVIATATRLLRLPAEVQREIENGRISSGHGRALLTTDDAGIQRQVAATIIDYGLSVRETENTIKRLSRKGGQAGVDRSVTRTVDPNVKVAETRLMRVLNTNVKIVPARKGNGGRVEIEYYSTDDLDRIYSVILSK